MPQSKFGILKCALLATIFCVEVGSAGAQTRYCQIKTFYNINDGLLHADTSFGPRVSNDTLDKYIPPFASRKFVNAVSLCNYMSRYHWELVSTYPLTGIKGDQYFIFRLQP